MAEHAGTQLKPNIGCNFKVVLKSPTTNNFLKSSLNLSAVFGKAISKKFSKEAGSTLEGLDASSLSRWPPQLWNAFKAFTRKASGCLNLILTSNRC